MVSGGYTIQPENERKGGITNNMLTFIIDPSRLLEIPTMQHEIEAMVDYVKASPPADPDKPVLIAGDPERISLKERERDGIPIDENTMEQILDAGVKMGLNHNELLKTSRI